MKMPDGGFRPAYNVQYTADCGSQAVVAVEVTTSGSDMGQLKPQMEQILKGGRKGATLEESCRNLIDAAKQAGGPDNVTAVLMRKTR